jgi:hypothetical protein
MIRNNVLAGNGTCQAMRMSVTAREVAGSRQARRAVSGRPACAARSIATISLASKCLHEADPDSLFL